MADKPKTPDVPAKKPTAIVLSDFADKDNFELKYKAGQDVSNLPTERIAELVLKGLVQTDGSVNGTEPLVNLQKTEDQEPPKL